jgi:UDP-glucose 4-epimerase
LRAVVVGGNGFIGSHLVDRLLATGWEVVVYDCAPERFRPPLPGVTYALKDLGDVSALLKVLPGADVVFHLVSTTIPQTSNDAPLFDLRTNLLGTVRFLQACVQADVGRVIFLSSGGTVYGIPTTTPVDEAQPTHPICSYGIVKLAIEKYLYLFEHLYGLSYGILRPSNPYGPRQNFMGKQGVVTVFLGRIAQGVPVTLWGDGTVVRDFFHVSDLARACLALAGADGPGRVFNVGSGQGLSLNALLDVIADVVRQPFEVQRSSGRPFDVPHLVLDVACAREALGWAPQVDLATGIADTWAWVQAVTEDPGYD